jgi:hypothetical protein
MGDIVVGRGEVCSRPVCAVPFAVREPLAGTDLDAGSHGLGVSVSLGVDDATALHGGG